jgi:hypothetical protein
LKNPQAEMSGGFSFVHLFSIRFTHGQLLSSLLQTGNNMRVKVCAGIVGAALLLAGCSSSNELSSAGQGVRFVEDKPGSECQLLGSATGEQSNWMSGQHGDEGGSMRGAANALRNQAAAMGGNVIYGVSSPSQGILSSFVPTASSMNGQVYKCPN